MGWRLFVLWVAVLLPACSSPVAPGRSDTGTWHKMKIGLCEDYPEESRTIEAAFADLELCATNRISVLRVALGWDAIEPEQGRFDWSFWDDFFRRARELNIHLIPYICYTPRWASSSGTPDFWRFPPREAEDFGRFVAEAVRRYPWIETWELWNEPDNPHYWLGTVEAFGELLEAGGRAVSSADPGDRVVMGGIAWNVAFLEGLVTNRSWFEHVDVVNVHNYFETWSAEPIEHLPFYLGSISDLLWRHGSHRPLWIAELGFSDHRGPLGAVSGQFSAHYDYEHTAEHQGASLFKMLTLCAATELVEVAAWYRVRDLPSGQEVIGDVNNRHLGILTTHGKPKPSFWALRHFEKTFGQGFRSRRNGVRAERATGSSAEIHDFELPDGSTVVVAWLRTVIAGQRGRPGGNVKDRREEVVTLELPGGAGERGFSLTDESGEKVNGLRRTSRGEFELRLRSPAVYISRFD